MALNLKCPQCSSEIIIERLPNAGSGILCSACGCQVKLLIDPTTPGFAKTLEQLKPQADSIPDASVADSKKQLARKRHTMVLQLKSEKRYVELGTVLLACRRDKIAFPGAKELEQHCRKQVEKARQTVASGESFLIRDEPELAFDAANHALLLVSDFSEARVLKERAQQQAGASRSSGFMTTFVVLAIVATGAGFLYWKFWPKPDVAIVAETPATEKEARSTDQDGWADVSKELKSDDAKPLPTDDPLVEAETSVPDVNSTTVDQPMTVSRQAGSTPTEDVAMTITPPTQGIGDTSSIRSVKIDDSESGKVQITRDDGTTDLFQFGELPTQDQDFILAAMKTTQGARNSEIELPPAGVKTQERPSTKWALIVAVEDYQKLPDLDYCNEDADLLAERFQNLGFPADQIRIVSDTANGTAPTHDAITAQIDELLTGRIAPGVKGIPKIPQPRLVGRNDVIVVAFSGHGIQFGNESYFCPADADLARPVETMVSISAIFNKLATVDQGLRLMFVDACRNSTTVEANKAPDNVESFQLQSVPSGVFAFCSCSKGQVSWEHEKLNHGVFSYYLQAALGGAGCKAEDDGSVHVRLTELDAFTTNYTTIFSKSVDPSKTQTPHKTGSIVGNPILGTLPPALVVDDRDIVKVVGDELPAVGLYDMELHTVKIPDLPKGWTAPDSIATAISGIGMPCLMNSNGVLATAELRNLDLRHDFFIEWEVGSSANFTQDFALLSGGKSSFPIRINYQSNILGGTVSTSLPETKPVQNSMSRPRWYFPMLFRLERRGRNYSLLLNGDETTICRCRSTFAGPIDGLSVSLLSSHLHSLRAGPLSTTSSRKAETTPFQFVSKNGDMPPNWYVDGEIRSGTARISSPKEGLILGDHFDLKWRVKRTDWGTYGLRLIGADGGRTLPIFFNHTGSIVDQNIEVLLPQSQLSSIAVPAKTYDFDFALKRSKDGFLLSVGLVGTQPTTSPLRSQHFSDFNQI